MLSAELRLSFLNGLLLLLIAAVISGVQVLDRGEAAVEAGVRRYAMAVSSSDLDPALAEIAPDQRATWRDWVRGQLGNVYEIRGIAVRSPSALQRLSGRAAGGPFEVTVVLDVNRDFADEFYQPTARVPVEDLDGRPYLARPLLASD